MRYIKVYDRLHNVLDELYEISGLKPTRTLNGMGRLEFDVPLKSTKCTETNFGKRNLIEVYEDDVKIWGGQISLIGFKDSKLHVSCYGYMSLLWKRRLRAKNYASQTYGSLFTNMLSDVNAIADTGVSLGNIASNALITQRSVKETDYILPKFQELAGDCNYDFDVDLDRKLNFYLRKGEDKTKYTLQYTGDGDNVNVAPDLSRSWMECANSIYSASDALTSTALNQSSIDEYGIMEGDYSASSGITTQSTLDNYVNGELQRRAFPADALTLSCIDSEQCPFSDIFVGDTITVYIREYWEYRSPQRILEITDDFDKNTREIVVGQTIYRPQPPNTKLYAR